MTRRTFVNERSLFVEVTPLAYKIQTTAAAQGQFDRSGNC